MIRSHQSFKVESYWIGLKGWLGGWYLDDDSPVTYNNFVDGRLPDEGILYLNSSLCTMHRKAALDTNALQIISALPSYTRCEKMFSSAISRFSRNTIVFHFYLE